MEKNLESDIFSKTNALQDSLQRITRSMQATQTDALQDSLQRITRSMQAIQTDALQDSLQRITRSMQATKTDALQDSLQRIIRSMQAIQTDALQDSLQRITRSMQATQTDALQDSLQRIIRSMQAIQTDALQDSLQRIARSMEMFKLSSVISEEDVLVLDKKMLSSFDFEESLSEMIIDEETTEELQEEIEQLTKSKSVLSTEVFVFRLIIVLQCIQMVGIDSDAITGLTTVLVIYLDRLRR